MLRTLKMIFFSILGFPLVLFGIVGFMMPEDRDFWVLWVSFIALGILMLYIGFKGKNKSSKKVDTKYQFDFPEDVMHELKKNYRPQYVNDTLRILNDCSTLVANSKNIAVVAERLELGKRHAIHLRQLEMINKYKKHPSAELYLDLFFGSADGILMKGITRGYEDVLLKASKLKTEKGKQNRINKFFDTLGNYDYMYSDDVIDFIEILKAN